MSEGLLTPVTQVSVPDFTRSALTELVAQCQTLREELQNWIAAQSTEHLTGLMQEVRRVRDTLQLIGKPGGNLLCNEMLDVMHRLQNKKCESKEEAIEALLKSGEVISDYVYCLKQGATDNSLSLLPAVNDCRAACDKNLLSAALITAAGIDTAQGTRLAEPGAIDFAQFQDQVHRTRLPLIKLLLNWYRSDNVPGETFSDISTVVGTLAGSCNSATSISKYKTLFDSAEIVSRALRDSRLENSPALKKLYAQLERFLKSLDDMEESEVGALSRMYPAELAQNFLYYVSQANDTTDNSRRLVDKYQLNRLDHTFKTSAPAIIKPLNERLASRIHASVNAEIAELRVQMEQPNLKFGTAATKHMLRHCKQLETAVLFLSAPQTPGALSLLVRRLESFEAQPSLFSESAKLGLAEQVLRIERSLADDIRYLQASSAASAQSNDAELLSRRKSQQQPGLSFSSDDALQKLLQEAQRRLLQVEGDLGDHFNKPLADVDRRKFVDEELGRIAGALMIVPLPEVRSLLTGLCEELPQSTRWSEYQQEQAARILIAVNFYLDCVLQPQAVASELLMDAEQALEYLRNPQASLKDTDQSLRNKAKAQIPKSLLTSEHPVFRSRLSPKGSEGAMPEQSNPAKETDLEDQQVSTTEEALSLLSTIAAGCMDLSLHTGAERSDTISELRDAFGAFGRLGEGVTSARDIVYYSEANVTLLNSLDLLQADSQAISEDTINLLDESVSVLPQLIDRLQGGTEPIFGLENLLSGLHEESNYVLGGNGDAGIDPLDPLDVDGTYPELSQTLLLNESDQSELDGIDLDAPITIDDELRQVYFRECASHLNTLETLVGRASRDSKINLPSDELLRALHTLSGCSHTVDAGEIIEIVHPLQSYAVQAHQDRIVFDHSQTRLLVDAVELLKTRLDAMRLEKELPPDPKSVQKRIEALKNFDQPGTGSVSADLASVFALEAVELFDKLRHSQTLFTDAASLSTAKSGALGTLHTIKGSARMVGHSAIADIAHELESTIQNSNDAGDCRRQIDAGLQAMEKLLGSMSGTSSVNSLNDPSTHNVAVPEKQATPVDGISTPNAAPLSAPANNTHGQIVGTADQFDRLLAVSTDVSVSQAQLSEKLNALKTVSIDIESAKARLERVAYGEKTLDGPNAQEILADLSLSQKQLAKQVRTLQALSAESSRVVKSLQQELVRTRLRRVSEMETRLQQVLGDTAEDGEKLAILKMQGGETTLDRTLFQQLLPVLEHLVRNAVVHGIESEAIRRKQAKKSAGKVLVSADIDGSDLVFTISDDGAGVSVEHLGAATGNSDSVDVTDLLTAAGFSTQNEVNQQAGRGIGLNAVKHDVQGLGGQINISTKPGQGTVVSLRIPQRLVVHQVLLVAVEQHTYAVAVNFIHGVLDRTSVLPGVAIDYQDKQYEAFALEQITAADYKHSESQAAGEKPAVLVDVNGRLLALCVDAIVGYREIISQPLGAQMQSLQRYSGGSVLADGTQVLIVDLQRALERPVELAGAEVSSAYPRLPVALLADDSITMRFAAEKMLSKLGFTVRTARDGAEAWDELQSSLPTVLVIDIDMPKLNGFDVIERLNKFNGDHKVPIIMISTQDTDDVYIRAQALGVARFINKPYLEEELVAALEFVEVMS